MVSLLSINDVDISVIDNAGTQYRGPGVAVVENGELQFGTNAWLSARQHPQDSNNQYFQRLNAEPLPTAMAQAQTYADLVYWHLEEIKQHITGPTVIATPSSITADQLGMLLGIANEVDIDVRQFVDSAVLCASDVGLTGNAWFIELSMHRAIVTELTLTEGQISRGLVKDVEACGYAPLIDGWINAIADQFIKETRFDPLHNAASEQQLHNQVLEWLSTISHQNEYTANIQVGQDERRATVQQQQLLDKTQRRMDPVLAHLPAGSTVVLSWRASQVRGIRQSLEAAGHQVVECTDNTLGKVFGERGEQLLAKASNPSLFTTLRSDHVVPAVTPQRPPATGLIPTHLISGTELFPLLSANHPLQFVEFTNQTHSRALSLLVTEGCLVNGQPGDPSQSLAVGDVISCEGIIYTLVVLRD